MAGCPYHGYQCNGNCMHGMAAQQQMGMSQYHDHIVTQMLGLQQRGLPVSTPAEEKKKPNKLLLLLR